jgi:hypothetical protein
MFVGRQRETIEYVGECLEVEWLDWEGVERAGRYK